MNQGLLSASTAVVLSVFLTACSTQPPMPELQQATVAQEWQTTPPPQVVLNNDDASTAEEQLVQWWQSLNDPLLNQLLEQVLINNPSLNSSGISYQIALLQAGIATNAYRPKGSVSTGLTEENRNKKHNTAFSIGGNVSWELDLWGTRRAERSKAKTASERSLDELHAAQVSLIAQTVQAYISLRTAQQHKQLAEKAIELRQQSYDLALWQHQAGIATELQQAQALTLLKQTEANLPPYQQAELEAVQQLQMLAGGDIDELLAELAQFEALPQAPESTFSLSAEFLRQRPDVQAQEKAIKEQTEAIVLARHARYPSFSLTGRITSSGRSTSDLFSADSIVASLAANLGYLLFDGGALRTQVKVQKLRLEQNLEEYRATLLTAEQEVSGALTALDSNQRQQESYQQALESAELAADLAAMQYDHGLLNFSELLDAQSAFLNSRSALLNNQAAVLNAWVQLYRSVGGGWQSLDHQPRVLTIGNDSE